MSAVLRAHKVVGGSSVRVLKSVHGEFPAVDNDDENGGGGGGATSS